MDETTIIYKLTTADWYTRKGLPGETLWGPMISHSGTGRGELCSPGWVHAYTDPLLAIMLNPIHADIRDPVLWRAEGWGPLKEDRGIKVGYQHVRTIEVIQTPVVTTEQKVKFAIYSGLEVYRGRKFVKWANDWLSGKDRSKAAAGAAWAEAAGAAWAEAAAAAAAAARWAEAARAAGAAGAAGAAARAAEADKPLDFISIARKAVS